MSDVTDRVVDVLAAAWLALQLAAIVCAALFGEGGIFRRGEDEEGGGC